MSIKTTILLRNSTIMWRVIPLAPTGCTIHMIWPQQYTWSGTTIHMIWPQQYTWSGSTIHMIWPNNTHDMVLQYTWYGPTIHIIWPYNTHTALQYTYGPTIHIWSYNIYDMALWYTWSCLHFNTWPDKLI